MSFVKCQATTSAYDGLSSVKCTGTHSDEKWKHFVCENPFKIVISKMLAFSCRPLCVICENNPCGYKLNTKKGVKDWNGLGMALCKMIQGNIPIESVVFEILLKWQLSPKSRRRQLDIHERQHAPARWNAFDWISQAEWFNTRRGSLPLSSPQGLYSNAIC